MLHACGGCCSVGCRSPPALLRFKFKKQPMRSVWPLLLSAAALKPSASPAITMAARLLCLARVGFSAAWLRPAVPNLARCCAPTAFSRAFSSSGATSAKHSSGIDMSSTVPEMREFALHHGISLTGMRLKADIFAAIQMHFGVFASVHAGARAAAESAQVQLQEHNTVAAAPVEDECSLQLKVWSLFAVAL